MTQLFGTTVLATLFTIGFVLMFVYGVLLIIWPAWTVMQWWSPINVKSIKRSRGLDPDTAEMPDNILSYRLAGFVFVVVLGSVVLRGFASAIADLAVSVVMVGILLLVLLSGLGWTFLPQSTIDRAPWLAVGPPGFRHRVVVRRMTGIVILIALAVTAFLFTQNRL